MRILVAPLDWGLGHATRCIPLIRALEAAGHTVIPCAGGGGLRLLRAEFPHLAVEEAPGYAMRYARRRALLLPALLAQLPLFLLSAWRAGRQAARLARRHRADLVITDGRYGFRARGVPAVFVTHQLAVIPPGPARLRVRLAPLMARLNRLVLRGYDAVWVPDLPGPANLSGLLGHPAPAWPRAAYIGPLCRFARGAALPDTLRVDVPPDPPDMRVDVLALVSGPEPQRTVFEEVLRAALGRMSGTRVLVRGVPGAGDGADDEPVRPGALTVFDHLPGSRLQALLQSADAIVCRSGYTTLMELAGLGLRNVLLVPTPGQPEQEYLAEQALSCGFAAWRPQEDPDVEGGLSAARSLPGFSGVTAFVSDGKTLGDLAARLRAMP